MTNILISGKDGYIATSLKAWIESKQKDYSIDIIDLRYDSWKNESFDKYDIVVHTAALVHKNESKIDQQLYMKVNADLTEEFAKKVKEAGVGYFVFFSTMDVYGVQISCFNKYGVSKETKPCPISKYGKSKFEAERRLKKLEDSDFKLAVLRPPFVYGKGCPGNYEMLKSLTLKIKMIPKFKNIKSMIYIDNLCECIYQLIVKRKEGVFTPQNKEIVSTYELALNIAKYNNTNVLCTSLFNPLVKLSSLFIDKIRRSFGNDFYHKNMSVIDGIEYNIVSFEKSVEETENRDNDGID